MANRLLAERISHERELRAAEKAAFDHERELRTVYDQHEREMRLQTEAAVEKARDTQIAELERRLESMNEFRVQLERQATTFLTLDRFEREHALLVERHTRDIGALAERVGTEERVTTRQDSAAASLEGIRSNNRWLIGIAIGLVSTFGLFALHVLGVVE
jgi:hypothetical protein